MVKTLTREILFYMGNGLLVSQFNRMLHQDIRFLVVLLFTGQERLI